jgi:outer membrane protein
MFHRILKMTWLAGLMTLGAATAQAGEPQRMTLTEAIATALGDSPTLAAAAQDSALARSRTRESRGDLYPSLVASASFTRHQEPNIVLPIHEAGVFPPLDDRIYESRLQLQLPVFDGGRRRAQIRAAEAAGTAAAARLDATRMELIEGIARIFVEARLLDDSQEIVAQRRAVLHERHRQVAALLAEGRVAHADLALVEASLSEVLADSLELASQRRQMASRLGWFVGSSAPVIPVPGKGAVPGSAVDGSPWPQDGITGLAATSPRLREAAALVEQSAARSSAAARSFWPELTAFTLLLSRSGGDLDFTTEWAIGAALELPLLTGGKRRAGHQASVAATAAARHRQSAALQEQHARETMTRERWSAAGLRRDAYLDAAAAKGRAIAAQRDLYSEGRSTLAELLAQEAEQSSLQLAAAEMQGLRRLALLDLHATAGTLTSDRARNIVEGES